MANPLQLVGALVVLLAMTVLTIVALFCERHQAEKASAFKTMNGTMLLKQARITFAAVT